MDKAHQPSSLLAFGVAYSAFNAVSPDDFGQHFNITNFAAKLAKKQEDCETVVKAMGCQKDVVVWKTHLKRAAFLKCFTALMKRPAYNTFFQNSDIPSYREGKYELDNLVRDVRNAELMMPNLVSQRYNSGEVRKNKKRMGDARHKATQHLSCGGTVDPSTMSWEAIRSVCWNCGKGNHNRKACWEQSNPDLVNRFAARRKELLVQHRQKKNNNNNNNNNNKEAVGETTPPAWAKSLFERVTVLSYALAKMREELDLAKGGRLRRS